MRKRNKNTSSLGKPLTLKDIQRGAKKAKKAGVKLVSVRIK